MNQPQNTILLVTGPARSGKSEWAETLAKLCDKSVIYIATATLDPTDKEWQNRIQRHQQRRPPDWETLHIPVDLAATLRQHSQPQTCFLVDSLGTWLANLLEQNEEIWSQTQEELLITLGEIQGTVIFVAEETGWGVVPAYPVGRVFRDRLGNLVRKIGAIAHSVYLVTGAYALNLSQLGTPLSQSTPPTPPF